MFDDIHDARELIGVAIGAGAMCWEDVSGAGVFDSTLATEVADSAYFRLQTVLAGHFSAPMDKTEEAVDELCKAIRLTVEYVGTETLHPGEGWSWFDALTKYRPEMAQHFMDWHNRVVAPTQLT